MPSPDARAPSALPRLLLLGLLWGITFPIGRYGVASGADPFLLVALAFALAAAVAAPIAGLRRAPWPGARAVAESAGLGALLIAGINLPLFWGERFATGGAASIVYAASPVLSLLVAVPLGVSASIGRRGALALGLGLTGVAVLGLASGGTAIRNPWAIAAFGLGAACQAVGAVAIVRRRPRGEGAWGATFQFAGGIAPSLLVAALVGPVTGLVLDLPVVVTVAYLGLVSMLAGYALFFDLLRTHGAVGANQVTFLNPVVALVVGVVIFGEAFAPGELAGLALILLALALLHVPARTPAGERGSGRPTPG